MHLGIPPSPSCILEVVPSFFPFFFPHSPLLSPIFSRHGVVPGTRTLLRRRTFLRALGCSTWAFPCAGIFFGWELNPPPVAPFGPPQPLATLGCYCCPWPLLPPLFGLRRRYPALHRPSLFLPFPYLPSLPPLPSPHQGSPPLSPISFLFLHDHDCLYVESMIRYIGS